MLEIVEAKSEEKDIMMNLLEKYLYEFSQWEKTDVNEEGLYGYEYLDCYFEEEHRYPYFVKVDGKLAGLVLVSDYPEVPEEKTEPPSGISNETRKRLDEMYEKFGVKK